MIKLEKGARVLACPGGGWSYMTVTRCHDDGTFDLMPEGADSFLDEWESVTREEIADDEDERWPAVHAAIKGVRPGIGWREAMAVGEAQGSSISPEGMKAYWVDRAKELFARSGDADDIVLDEGEAYRFFVDAGYSARQLAAPRAPVRERYFRLYWNSIRMGGRDPSGVGRPIGLADALASLGLTDASSNSREARALAAYEQKHGLTLPTTLKQLWSRKDALNAICGGHCNNPEPCQASRFAPPRDAAAVSGKRRAVRIMLPHQGDHAWWAVFDDGDDDAAIWISFEEDGGPERRVAASLPFFFWDLAETNRCWVAKQREEDEDDAE